jgi:hypothetical protein
MGFEGRSVPQLWHAPIRIHSVYRISDNVGILGYHAVIQLIWYKVFCVIKLAKIQSIIFCSGDSPCL